jgi:ferredoxin/flavodoxin---NADP+ reductase
MTKNNTQDLFDITFIGAGPTGLFGAFYAGLRDMSVKMIDALPGPGGQLTALYPEKLIYDTPGFPAIKAKDLVANLVEQAARWDVAYHYAERAIGLRRETISIENEDHECWLIETDKGLHYTTTVVISAGIGAFQPVKLRNESIDQFEGKGVEYLLQDINKFSGKRVLVIGGGDSAVDWALALEPVAEEVTLIHRRDGFRAHDASLEQLNDSSVNVQLFYELDHLEGEDSLERAIILNNKTEERSTLELDYVIPALGFKANLGPIREWGLETIGRRYLKINSRAETNLPGVFAAGDIALQGGLDALNLIVVGYGRVTIAVNYAYTVVKPGAKVFPGHSSEKMAK